MKKPKIILVPRDKGFDSGLVRLELLLLRPAPKDWKRVTPLERHIGRIGLSEGTRGAGRSANENPTSLYTPPTGRRDGN